MHEVRLFILIVLLILFLIVIFPLIFLFFWRLVVAMLPSVLFTLQSKVDGTLADLADQTRDFENARCQTRLLMRPFEPQ